MDSGIGGNDDVQQPYTGGGNRIVAAVNFVPDHPGAPVPANGGGDANDHCGHGTHVAGIIAGNGKSSSDDPNSHDKKFFRHFYGVAPGVSLVNVRVLDGQGGGTVGQVVAGLQWVVANAKTYNIRVINLSLGHPVGESYTTDPLCQAVEAAYKAGIVVVCAAGNNGRLNGSTNTPGLDNEGWGTAYGSIESPGNDPYVITVGAMKGSTYDAYGAYQVAGARRPDRHLLRPRPDPPGPDRQA